MARPKDPEIEARNQEIGTLWISGSPSSELASQFGLSLQSIRKIIKDLGLKGEHRKFIPTRRSMYDRRPLSNLHAQIGQYISVRRITEFNEGVDVFAKRVNMSRNRLKEIETGVYDMSLGELVRVCKVLEIEPYRLLEDRTDQQPILERRKYDT